MWTVFRRYNQWHCAVPSAMLWEVRSNVQQVILSSLQVLEASDGSRTLLEIAMQGLAALQPHGVTEAAETLIKELGQVTQV